MTIRILWFRWQGPWRAVKFHSGLAICGSGVGACVAANKVPGVRAALITDPYSAHQGVEDDDMNVMCLGGRVTGPALAWDLVQTFLNACFKEEERFKRRIAKVATLETRRCWIRKCMKLQTYV